MPRDIQSRETFSDQDFPINGVDNLRGYALQRPGTTLLGQNVRAFEPDTQRARGGSRPGLAKYIAGQIPGGEALIQNLNFVVYADGTALIANYNDTAPHLFDPSSYGPPEAWGPGRFTRSPPLSIPDGGWGIPPNKNLPMPPLIVWANPATIAVGTALGGTQLNAVANDRVTGHSIPGTYTYSPASGVQLPLGLAQALAVSFTPTDTTNYLPASAGAVIDVIQGSGQKFHFVQQKGGHGTDGGSGGDTVTWDSFSSSTSVGNLLVLAIGFTSAAAGGLDIFSVSDSQFNVWQRISTTQYSSDGGGSFQCLSVWYTKASSSTTCTISFTFNGTIGSHAIPAVALEYSGNDPTPLDNATSNSSNTTPAAPTAGAVSVAGSHELVLGIFNNTSGPGPGFTHRVTGGSTGIFVEEILDISANTSVTAVSTPDGSVGYSGVGASFKAVP